MSMLTVFYRRRIRMVQYGAICFTVCALVFDTPTAPTAPTAPSVIALVVAAVGVLLCLVRATASSADVERAVEPPVRGRWLALNSPSTKVPSHGIRAYGQAYAIDLARWPDEGELDRGAGWARPEDVIGFGDSVHAMVDGEVVRASGWRRDHRCRTSVFALFYLFIEGSVRELLGLGWILGNHVVIRSGDGSFALVAHLRRGSVRVRVGVRVRAGDRIGECGNSGNTTVPHVHAQLMDRASASTGIGLPLCFRDVAIEEADADLPAGIEPAPAGDRYAGVPADGEVLVSR